MAFIFYRYDSAVVRQNLVGNRATLLMRSVMGMTYSFKNRKLLRLFDFRIKYAGDLKSACEQANDFKQLAEWGPTNEPRTR